VKLHVTGPRAEIPADEDDAARLCCTEKILNGATPVDRRPRCERSRRWHSRCRRSGRAGRR
jgi:hypothetical protein